MDKYGKVLTGLYVVLIFLAGFLSAQFWLAYQTGSFGGITGYVVSGPGNFLNDNDLLVYSDRVVLRVENARVTQYGSTGSMEPILGAGVNGISVKPKSSTEIGVGDIVSFWRDGELIVHRVIEQGSDSEGVFFVTKGDSASVSDGKVRFSEIEHVLIGVVY